jgi:hypothetical protein
MASFYFTYSIKPGQRPYNDHTNRSHQNKVSKHTKLLQNARESDKALCLIHRHSLVQSKESALCANFRGHHHLFPPAHLQSVRPRRSLSPGLPSTPPRRQMVPPPWMSPSRHVCRRDATAPCRRDSTLSMCKIQTRLLQETNHPSLAMMHTSKIDAPKGKRLRSAAIVQIIGSLVDPKLRASPTVALNFGAVKTVCSALDPLLAREAVFTSNGSSKFWGS